MNNFQGVSKDDDATKLPVLTHWQLHSQQRTKSIHWLMYPVPGYERGQVGISLNKYGANSHIIGLQTQADTK